MLEMVSFCGLSCHAVTPGPGPVKADYTELRGDSLPGELALPAQPPAGTHPLPPSPHPLRTPSAPGLGLGGQVPQPPNHAPQNAGQGSPRPLFISVLLFSLAFSL